MAKDCLCKAKISWMACVGLYQRKMSKLLYEVIKNFPFGEGSKGWDTLELKVFPRGTC